MRSERARDETGGMTVGIVIPILCENLLERSYKLTLGTPVHTGTTSPTQPSQPAPQHFSVRCRIDLIFETFQFLLFTEYPVPLHKLAQLNQREKAKAFIADFYVYVVYYRVRILRRTCCTIEHSTQLGTTG